MFDILFESAFKVHFRVGRGTEYANVIMTCSAPRWLGFPMFDTSASQINGLILHGVTIGIITKGSEVPGVP